MAEDKCLAYTKRSVEIFFPEGRVCCQLCPALQTYSRNQCMLTGEFIADTRGVGGWCKLVDPETGNIEGRYY